MPDNTNQFEIAQISHELANPITLIYSSLQRLEKEHPELITYSHWDGVMDEIRHAQKLLWDIRLMQACDTLHKTTFSYVDFTQEVSHSFHSFLQEKNQTLLLQCPSELPFISADRLKLRQVIENLIKNASEASPSNAMIAWRIHQDSSLLINEVIDSGSGLKPGYETSLFDPFVTSKENGTGLGLAICRQIIESHAGTIRYEENPSGGMTFTFCLPIP